MFCWHNRLWVLVTAWAPSKDRYALHGQWKIRGHSLCVKKYVHSLILHNNYIILHTLLLTSWNHARRHELLYYNVSCSLCLWYFGGRARQPQHMPNLIYVPQQLWLLFLASRLSREASSCSVGHWEELKVGELGKHCLHHTTPTYLRMRNTM